MLRVPAGLAGRSGAQSRDLRYGVWQRLQVDRLQHSGIHPHCQIFFPIAFHRICGKRNHRYYGYRPRRLAACIVPDI